MADTRKASLDRLHRALGHKQLSRCWAKCEVLLGLLAAGIGLSLIASDAWQVLLDVPVYRTAIGILLFVFGGYLAMAGHRSHLYQSNNELASYLADLIEQRRSVSASPTSEEHEPT
jgi:hypothetical protein